MSAVGAGKVKVNVPSPLFTAAGPPAGSQFQNGPVNLNTVLLSVGPHTSVVITRSVEGAGPQSGKGQAEV